MSETEEINAQSQEQSPATMSSNLPKLATYMRFMGLLAMIGGVLYCLTIIGALIGVPYFIMGQRLRESADAFNNYNASGTSGDLNTAIEKQTKAFFIQYVLAIIGLVLLGIYLIVIIAIFAGRGF